MIRLIRISTRDTEEYAYMEKLLIDSFPVDEYRALDELRELSDNEQSFHCTLIHDNNQTVGFLNYWEFDTFYYIEHFAIEEQHRSSGYGGKLLDFLNELFTKPIVLEVELPDTEIAARRIAFYKRHEYTLWEQDYFQPPYKERAEKIPMYLMARGKLTFEEDGAQIINTIYKEVYHYQ